MMLSTLEQVADGDLRLASRSQTHCAIQRTEHIPERAGHGVGEWLPDRARGQHRRRILVIETVGDVEHLDPELETLVAAAETDVLARHQIELPEARPTQIIPWQVAERARHWRCESGWVEP